MHRERLLRNGFLMAVMKGWYIPARPDDVIGESSAWYASYWGFCAAYLQERFGTDWSLSPEQSLLLHVGNMTVPGQLLVRSPKGRNKVTRLPYDTSLLDTRASLPKGGQTLEKDGLRLFSVPAGLISCGPGFFLRSTTDARAALAMVRDSSEVLGLLLEGGHSTIAGRLAGAFRSIGRKRTADDIVRTMEAAGYDVREKNPFHDTAETATVTFEQSPYVNRIRLMWQQMRAPVLKRFPASPGLPSDVAAYLKAADDMYVTDAYHSLSIEGYRVSREHIRRVRSGEWNPEENDDDREQRNALAARGYWQAYRAVRESISRILEGENPGEVCEDDHREWYRQMFAPSVTAGLLRPSDLAGYRSDQVYIRRSMHVPPRYEAVRDCIPAMFDLLRQEPEPSVRVVLGHFMLVFIHPYMDGNGRCGRFLMNAMLASGGHPWTVVPVDRREEYMGALEAASVEQDIEPFVALLGDLVSNSTIR